ncbi:VOC family protein [Actinokineospora auranticolor]|uniref:Catechol 2,3-dioxygenase-like lactoylglutathione lyase family enzyme n=1 Tax=Actinokineospora auranticolor TaxID=155976 RepID=A0A2S6GVG1_9PSEU|nr:VOC family protein [Actinokineospora auranticolor]PPK69177.1 catechol 2,3-dioxygenase-like lactoylglutathione lyase family enzyme [Actinokineospora auranticolor]
MQWTLEVVVVPVSDVDVAKEFYAEKVGFVLDHDTSFGDNRFVQLTPPGSGCSIVLGPKLEKVAPGELGGVQLVVNDLWAAHAELSARGVQVSEVQFASPQGFRAATEEDDLNNAGFLFFADPDGNSWTVQQITARA